MGIKGRRKRLRERHARLQENGSEGDHFYSGQGSDADESQEECGIESFSPSVPLNASGELKIKKSELYKMQDYDYLDRIREEHEQRRRPTLSRAKQMRTEADLQREVENVDATLLGHRYTKNTTTNREIEKRCDTALLLDEDLLKDANSNLCGASPILHAAERSTPAVRGPRFSHPLLGLSEITVSALEACGWTRMTRIQERTIPYALQGYDILGQARTGSGKTLAFCVPILHSASLLSTSCAIQQTIALLLAPTKELCVQTEHVLQNLIQKMGQLSASTTRTTSDDRGDRKREMLTVKLITGGTKAQEERRWLSAGVSIVVGTPGRVHDHACRQGKCWNLTHIKYFVLDEADRMLADGFQRDLDAILSALPKGGRQTLLFSATNSKSVQALARLSLYRTPIMIRTTGAAPEPVEVETFMPNADMGAGSMMATASLPPYPHFSTEEEDHETPKCAEEAPHTKKKSALRENTKMNENTTYHKETHTTALVSLSFRNQKKNDVVNAKESAEGEEETAEEDSAAAIPSTLRQFCHVVRVEDRLVSLYVFVKQIAKKSKGMVFCSTVASTTFHYQMLGSIGFHNEVMMLHGHMKHRQRIQAFETFNEWKTGVLFCTDVAARGLDIPLVEWILQYDPPLDPTEYIHRIGRTARAGRVGNSLLFLSPEEVQFIAYLKKFDIHLEKYPMPPTLPNVKEKMMHVLQLDPIVAKSAIAAYRAHVGAYQSHILKETFDVQQLDLKNLATAFALSAAPGVTLPKNSAEEKKQDYVKGKLKSLNRRRKEALRHYEEMKTKRQWDGGVFVGISKPI